MPSRELDPLKDYDVNELSEEEQVTLAHARANVSKEDFDPREVEAHEHVVELADHSSHLVKDLVDHPDPVIASDAQSVVDGNFPGGPNYPNGPAEPRKAAAKREESKPAQQSNQ